MIKKGYLEIEYPILKAWKEIEYKKVQSEIQRVIAGVFPEARLR